MLICHFFRNYVMQHDFIYDAFLSHSSKDKDMVRGIAKQLRDNGLKVWFDEWEVAVGDNIIHKIDQGLELSRTLIVCLSSNSIGSDWAQMETGVFRFRDPLNKSRRLLPLRLDAAPIKESLAQFAYLNWGDENAFAKLCEACGRSAIIRIDRNPVSAEPVRVPDWFIKQLPPEHHLAFKRNARFRDQFADFGQPVSGIHTIFFEANDSSGAIKLQIIELAGDANGTACLENLNVGSVGQANLPSQIYCCRSDGTIFHTDSSSLESAVPIQRNGMLVIATGYGEPLLSAKLGRSFRDWIAVEVVGFTKGATSGVEYSFAIASERMKIGISMAASYPPFEQRDVSPPMHFSIKASISNSLKNILKAAVGDFENSYGKGAFRSLCNSNMDSIKWQIDYNREQVKNMAYVIEGG